MHPHLLALLQVTQSAIGTTPEPSITPMKVCHKNVNISSLRRLQMTYV